ncbi:hypothetical protein Y032_0002g693 [Ancylostoma ceylanicum]|uniref:Uncharacterized protein n=1 Tax=Ancylostoma ceylanicum TaxID=53326 RepID=A0A016W0T5_9BILA|nr:hypothetical protein Y032_0002g693 [Ancylostoma ceylanicum]
MPAEPLSRKTHCPNDTTVLVFVYTRVYHLEQSLDELIGRTPEFSGQRKRRFSDETQKEPKKYARKELHNLAQAEAIAGERDWRRAEAFESGAHRNRCVSPCLSGAVRRDKNRIPPRLHYLIAASLVRLWAR